MKIKSLIIIVIVFASIIIGCTKEQLLKKNDKTVNNTETTTISKTVNCNDIYSKVQLVDGKLSFQSQEDFEEVVNCLEESYNSINDDYYGAYSNLDDDELAMQEQIDNFNPFQNLEYFENYYSFNSLRKKLKISELEWLDNEVLDWSQYPYNSVYTNIYYNTLLNENKEVLINGQTITFNESFGFSGKSSSGCESIRSVGNNYTYSSGTKQYRATFVFGCSLFMGFLPVTNRWVTISSYKKSGSRWVLYTTDIWGGMEGNIRKMSNCSVEPASGKSTDYKRRQIHTVSQTWWAQSGAVVPGTNECRSRFGVKYQPDQVLGI